MREKVLLLGHTAQENKSVSCCEFAKDWSEEKKEKGRSEMASTAAVPFWRAAGMTYITYSNICANLVRNCLKEPFKAEALNREKVHFSLSKWAGGKPEKPSKLLFFCQNHLRIVQICCCCCCCSPGCSNWSWVFIFVLVLLMDLIKFHTVHLLNLLISQIVSNTWEHKRD